MSRSLILIFLKYPEPGRVKTRLANTIGSEGAAIVYRRLVREVLQRVGNGTDSEVRILFDPPSRTSEIEDWIREIWDDSSERLNFEAQSEGELGDRLNEGFKTAFDQGYQKVTAIGTDCIDLSKDTFQRTWSELESHDAVFGPTDDGGYYLIGLRKLDGRIFQVPWSQENTLSESLRRCEECQFSVALLEQKSDIDTSTEWEDQKAGVLRSTQLNDEPLGFAPVYQERVWGGRTMADQLGRELPGEGPFGESWEVVDRTEAQSYVNFGAFLGFTLNDLWSGRREEIFGENAVGERFPLLLKILDARSDLSIQVHPPADVAEELGGEAKTEMWYIAHAESGSQVYAGLKPGITADKLQQSLADGTTADLVHAIPVKAGDFLFIESGRLHAIGQGILIYEFQQNSDTTYRVFDWNRLGLDGVPRRLHVDQALKSIDFSDIEPEMTKADGETLVSCPYFVVEKWSLNAAEERRGGETGQFAVFTVITGRIHCGSRQFTAGDFFAIPAATASTISLRAVDSPASVLRMTLPESSSQPLEMSPTEHEGFYRKMRQKVVDWSETRIGREHRWVEFILLAPDFFHLLSRLAFDQRVPRKYRMQLGCVIAYFVSPIDLLPEGILGPLGYLDDVALAAYVINQLVNKIDPAIVEEHWAGEGEALSTARNLIQQADEMLGSGLWEQVKKIWGAG